MARATTAAAVSDSSSSSSCTWGCWGGSSHEDSCRGGKSASPPAHRLTRDGGLAWLSQQTIKLLNLSGNTNTSLFRDAHERAPGFFRARHRYFAASFFIAALIDEAASS